MHARNSSKFLLALDSVQARSQAFYGEVRSKKETDQMRPKGQVSRVGGRGGGGELWLSETELRGKCTIGARGVDVERANVCHLGLSGGMLPPPSLRAWKRP